MSANDKAVEATARAKSGGSVRRGIATNWMTFAITIVVSFYMSPIVVKSLGSTSYGIWALVLQLTGYFNLFDFGVKEAVIRYTAKYVARGQSRQLRAILSTALVTYVPVVVTTLVVTGLCVLLVPGPFGIEPSHYEETRWAVLFTGLTIAFGFVFNAFTGVIAGLRRFDISNGIAVGFLLLRSVVIIVLLRQGYGLVALAAVIFVSQVLQGIIGLVVSRRLLRARGVDLRYELPRGKRLPATMRRVFGFGAYALLHSLGQKIIFSSDTIIVAAFMTVSAVTPYSIAGTLVQYLRNLLTSTVKVFMPATSELQARGMHAEQKLLVMRSARFSIYLVLPIAIVFLTLGSAFIRLWMGEQFVADATAVLTVLALAQIFSAPSYALVSALYGTGKHALMSVLRIGEAAVNVTLSIVLVQRLGLVGVALGTAISHVLLVIGIVPVLVCPQLKLTAREYLVGAYLRPLLAALPFAALAWLIAHTVYFRSMVTLLLVIMTITVFYVFCIFFLGMYPDERRMLLKRLGWRQRSS
jgi:O-antigen/teichoic acid export membrane protein